MRVFALTAIASIALATSAAAQATCARCERTLQLTRGEWSCLMQRLPELSSTSTSMVFFSLAPNICDPDTQTDRSGAVRAPSATASDQRAPRVYRLSRAQVECLAREAARTPVGDQVNFNFEAACR